jgi:CheY-like chemotaxis protein
MSVIRILIVEDEEIVAMDLEARLGLLGYEIAGNAATGERAVALAQEVRPDLVLMDIRLRGEMDGVTAAGIIRHRFSLPVIFLTAHSEATTLERAKLAVPFGYLLKPFEDRELRTTIEMALYQHSAERAILHLNRLYAVLLQINQSIIRASDALVLCSEVCDIAVRFGGFPVAWIGEYPAEPDRGGLVLRAMSVKDDAIRQELSAALSSEVGAWFLERDWQTRRGVQLCSGGGDFCGAGLGEFGPPMRIVRGIGGGDSPLRKALGGPLHPRFGGGFLWGQGAGPDRGGGSRRGLRDGEP